MGFRPPPLDYRGKPNLLVLQPGTLLWRVRSERFEAVSFNPKPADRYFGGGRFDSTADEWYPFLYAAPTEETALAERLLRGLPFPDGGRKRTVPRQMLSGLRLSALTPRTELTLISLQYGQDLAAIRQEDGWLVEAEAREYAFTRVWAHWLRRAAPRAQGLIWKSHRNLGQQALVLFGDRCPDNVLASAGPHCVPLDGAAGAGLLNEKLAPFHARVSPPRDRTTLSETCGGMTRSTVRTPTRIEDT